jgi:hypothetical protein
MTLRTLFVTLVATTVLAQQAPKDVEGWREARWGMSKAQILQTFQEAKQEPPLKISRKQTVDQGVSMRLMLSGFLIRVHFEFNDKDELNSVVLEPGNPGVAQVLGGDFYNKMLPLLIEKYGSPINANGPLQDGAQRAVWSFPSTSIELIHENLPLTKIKIAEIRYHPNGSKRDKDNL